MTEVNTETETDTVAVVSCVINGLTQALDAVSWTDDSGSPLASDNTNYVISDGSFSDSTHSQTTTLTVMAGVSTDTQYSCVVTSDEWIVTDHSTSVLLNVFGR